MIVSSNRIPVSKGFEQEFEERFKHRSRLVDKMEGFIDVTVLRPIESDHYIVLTYWKTMADFKKWTESEAFAQAHAKPYSKELYSGQNIAELFEVIEN